MSRQHPAPEEQIRGGVHAHCQSQVPQYRGTAKHAAVNGLHSAPVPQQRTEGPAPGYGHIPHQGHSPFLGQNIRPDGAGQSGLRYRGLLGQPDHAGAGLHQLCPVPDSAYRGH